MIKPIIVPSLPFISLYEQLDRAFSSLQVENMKSVEQEDSELNDNFDVDPLSDPRYDKLDLFNLVDGETRDRIMNANPSFASVDSDDFHSSSPIDLQIEAASSASGSGE